ncbi:hypothetical protein HKK55_19520 [Pseudomonas sp. ADAK18]|nr:hypothetical protein HKK55_19520 [Pseudomonas sp. ADAK18]
MPQSSSGVIETPAVPPEQVVRALQLMKGIDKPEQDVRLKPDFATGRPPGDKRSAEQIINDNPILKNLGHQKDINREQAYSRLGDWSAENKDPDARADAAFNAAKVLNYIDTSLSASGQQRGTAHNNGDLEGITSSGDARHGTPAGMWKDFTEQGYTALRDDHRLDATKDPYVRPNGTNKGNLQGLASQAGQSLWFVPGLSNILQGVGNAEGGLGGVKSGVEAGIEKTRADGFDKAMAGAASGDVKAMVKGYAETMIKNEATPESVKEALKQVSEWLS